MAASQNSIDDSVPSVPAYNNAALVTPTTPDKPALSVIPNGLFTKWNNIELTEWLKFKGVSYDVANIFKDQNINGELLSTKYFWNHEKLKRMGISFEGDRQLCLDLIEDLRHDLQNHKSTVFQDSLHGPIEIHPLLVKIIDTPQFQRLRDIKQLGGVYYVYPGASHNRFEHSIGVCYMAGVFVENLKLYQPELGITDCDVLCVKVAALCHDMGHGPFSDFFQQLFIPEVCNGLKWTHEETSIKLMDYMMEVNKGLHYLFKQYGLGWENERIFIQELILGTPLERDEKFKGRDTSKHFLYEIIANKFNCVDVDKIDSLLRDASALGIAVHFDWRRYIRFCRVVKDETGQAHICPRDKEVREVFEYCNFRDYLFQAAYQHRTKRAVELMILKVMKQANDHLLLPGKGGNLVKISEAIGDMEAFTRLTDGILHTIAVYSSTNSKLVKARKSLDKLHQRKLFMLIGRVLIAEPQQKALVYKLDFPSLIIEKCTELELLPIPKTDKLMAELVKFDFGFNRKKSIEHIWFYQKAFPNKPVTIRKRNIPRRTEEWELRIYYAKYDPKTRDAAKIAFTEVCKSNGIMGPFEDVRLYTEEETELPLPPLPADNEDNEAGGNCCIT